jgi:glycerate 2-kinase
LLVSPREAARAIWRAALAAGDVAPLLRSRLRLDGDVLAAGDFRFELGDRARVIVLGAGKAGASMARALEAILGDRISDGFVVVKDAHRLPSERIELAEAGHPVPDARGLAASARLLALAETATADDLVIVLISGGGSALTPAPAPPVTLEDKQAVTRLLLAAGATIGELNTVRKHLSRFKGGLLAREAWPATVLMLALSDVIGDPLDVIASGPTVPDPTHFADALSVLERRGVIVRAPASVLERLRAGARGDIPETPKPGDRAFERVSNLVVGNNALVADAARVAAEALGYRATLLTLALEGEARHVAGDLLIRARGLPSGSCLIAAGETTVTVRGAGRGGRCQELALAAALGLSADEGLAVLAAGTDGTDGPTDAAGALVDAGTVGRGRAAGLDPERTLADNDANAFLAASGDLIVTGPTNTNLLDLYLVLRS